MVIPTCIIAQPAHWIILFVPSFHYMTQFPKTKEICFFFQQIHVVVAEAVFLDYGWRLSTRRCYDGCDEDNGQRMRLSNSGAIDCLSHQALSPLAECIFRRST